MNRIVTVQRYVNTVFDQIPDPGDKIDFKTGAVRVEDYKEVAVLC